MTLRISRQVELAESEIEISAMRAQGPGGQNVNKVESAVHLRFDIRASSLPDHYKERLLARADHRISAEGVVVIKSQEHRSRELNRTAALERLAALIREAVVPVKKRHPTRPTRGSQERRLAAKKGRGRTKSLRGSLGDW